MANIVFRQQALDDLNAIFLFTRQHWSQNQAISYYRAIQKGCKEAAVNPKKGKDYSSLYEGLWGYPIGKHIVFYRMTGPKGIEVIRILHGKMDLQWHLRP
jgi:toxin ParE1/3/4